MKEPDFKGKRVSIPLRNPIKTGTNQYSIDSFDNANARHLQNTGIYQGGSLVNLYERETAYSITGDNYETEDGHVLTVSSPTSDGIKNVFLDGDPLGYVSQYGIVRRLSISSADACLTADNTYITMDYSCSLSANVLAVTVKEYDLTGAILNTKQHSFSFGAVSTKNISRVTIFKNYYLHYSDTLEFFVEIVGQMGSAFNYPVWLKCTEGISSPDAFNVYASYTYTTVGEPINAWKFSGTNGYFVWANGGNAYYIQSDWSTYVKKPTISSVYYHPIMVDSTHTVILHSDTTFITVANQYNLMDYWGELSAGFTTTPTVIRIANTDSLTNTPTTNSLCYAEVVRAPSGSPSTWKDGAVFSYQGYLNSKMPDTYRVCAHGVLNGFSSGPFTVVPSPFVLRACMVNDGTGTITPSYLSVAPLVGTDKGSDGTVGLGTMISNVGEVNFQYLIEFLGTNVLYQYNNEFILVVFGTSSFDIPAIQKIAPNLYKINTISPLNIVDTSVGSLFVGSSDYNGRALLDSTASSAYTVMSVMTINNTYYSSIPSPQQNISGTSDFYSYLPFCAYIEGQPERSDFWVDVYLDDGSGLIYFESFNANGESYRRDSLVGSIYASGSLLIPPAIGQIYGERYIVSQNKILLLDWYYTDQSGNQHPSDMYVIGNEVTNFQTAFTLYGQVYTFDGDAIWSAVISNNQFQSKEYVCNAIGLSFLCSSPQAIFFLSGFDNSLWTFDGSRSVSKIEDFNQYQTITQGIFSSRDSSLLLDSGDYLIWMRSNGITANAKKTNQAGTLRFYSTFDGIKIGNNINAWQYSFYDLGSSTVKAIVFQSAYYGQRDFERSIEHHVNYLFQSATKEAITITVYMWWYDQDGSGMQSRVFNIAPSDYSDVGTITLRLQPEVQRTLGMSVGYSCSSRINCLEITIVADDETEAIISRTA